MSQPLTMPNLGSGMEEGTLLGWTKQVGDTIKEGDVIAEIDADKATVEVPATAAGVITQFLVEAGAVLKVGAVIGYVAAAGEAQPAAGEAQPEAAPQAAPASAPAQSGEPLVQPYGGGQPSADAASPFPTGAAPQSASSAEVGVTAAPVDPDLPGGVRATPIARRIAEEKGIDLRQVTGTGPNGRIQREDVESFQPGAAASAPAAAPAAAAPAPAPAATTTAPTVAAFTPGKLPSGPDVEIIDTTKMRSRIAARMVESKQQIPHFYVTVDIDVEPMLALRKQINATLDDAHKVSVNDLIVKATALTLRQFPNLNTHYYGDKLVRHKRIHIGIAVALPQGGLINVVTKDADVISISAIAAQNKAMIARARENKVKPDDITGSTFTVSNLGAYDVEHFVAIINPPEAGILAIGTAKQVAIVKPDGSLGVGNRMKVTVSVDHRVSDGAEGAQFLQAFKKLLEQPMQLLI